MADFTIIKGDRLPAFAVVLKNSSGAAIDLTARTVNFYMKSGSTTKSGACTITDASNGACEYRWAAGDTTTAAEYNAKFEIVEGDGRVRSAPNYAYLTVSILAEQAK